MRYNVFATNVELLREHEQAGLYSYNSSQTADCRLLTAPRYLAVGSRQKL